METMGIEACIPRKLLCYVCNVESASSSKQELWGFGGLGLRVHTCLESGVRGLRFIKGLDV